MLQLAHRTSAPSAASVSMRTAVCTVMCKEPVIRAPRSGWLSENSRRGAIRPGISCSASSISLRPNSARDRSATLKSGLSSGEVMLATLVAGRDHQSVGGNAPDVGLEVDDPSGGLDGTDGGLGRIDGPGDLGGRGRAGHGDLRRD